MSMRGLRPGKPRQRETHRLAKVRGRESRGPTRLSFFAIDSLADSEKRSFKSTGEPNAPRCGKPSQQLNGARLAKNPTSGRIATVEKALLCRLYGALLGGRKGNHQCPRAGPTLFPNRFQRSTSRDLASSFGRPSKGDLPARI